MTHPVVSREEWLAARRLLLEQEKEATRLLDEVRARRRALPMVAVEKDYRFTGPDGPAGLADLFEGRRQLIVYHFMFAPDWEEGCTSCSLLVDNIGHLAHLHGADTTLALVSRAPAEKIAAFRARMGWQVPWYSSHGDDFNYDFHASNDEQVAPVEYNYYDKAALERRGLHFFTKGEGHAASVFVRDGDGPDARVLHSYSCYGRGPELLVGTFNYLDLTPSGRQRHISEFPHHDRYGAASGGTCH
ncbi:hypothetical protein Sru01_19730 [Sphaerisporangium rufum]|uniref:DUF899 domain-containing protein n=1 Tax=Sphaerisporangium rufum TaxID=1381558 RepID=A0A919UXG6_9ACTN|nr:DUF899 domain-containing protein [Sphaerisporangium rufum]GII76991.1 hypothetical protein Sru01_19730 [Sphaerisporangium rufum]